jgi:micrococcal nuclease
MKMKKMKAGSAGLFFVVILMGAGMLGAQGPGTQDKDYNALVASLRVTRAPEARRLDTATPGGRAADGAGLGLNKHQVQVRAAWESGKLIDEYLLVGSQRASEVVKRLAEDLKDDPSRLYYALQFYRAYPDAQPLTDLPWGYYQYFLAVNDPREREALVGRAFAEKWNWDRMRAEVKLAGRDNKEYVFTDTPGKPGTYRVMTAKRGPYRGQKVLDLGLGNDYKPSFKIQAADYAIVRARGCEKAPSFLGPCRLADAPGAEKDLFTYPADVVKVFDGDTFEATVDLGFGVTARRHFRLWGLDAPEINTREGRRAQKFMEDLLNTGPVTVRAMRPDKYGRYLADVWVVKTPGVGGIPTPGVDRGPQGKPVYANQALIDAGLAVAQDRTRPYD